MIDGGGLPCCDAGRPGLGCWCLDVSVSWKLVFTRGDLLVRGGTSAKILAQGQRKGLDSMCLWPSFNQQGRRTWQRKYQKCQDRKDRPGRPCTPAMTKAGLKRSWSPGMLPSSRKGAMSLLLHWFLWECVVIEEVRGAVSSAKCPQDKGHPHKVPGSGVSITGPSPSTLSPKRNFLKWSWKRQSDKKIWLAGGAMLRDNTERGSVSILLWLWLSVKHRHFW